MIKPEFPYRGSQAILSSDRVMLYAKKESILLLGKGTVGISSPGTINLDSKEKVLIFSPKIELGSKATEQVILGNSMVRDLKSILEAIKNLSDTLSKINESNFAATIPGIRFYSDQLSSTLNDKIISIDNNLSKVTYTE